MTTLAPAELGWAMLWLGWVGLGDAITAQNVAKKLKTPVVRFCRVRGYKSPCS